MRFISLFCLHLVIALQVTAQFCPEEVISDSTFEGSLLVIDVNSDGYDDVLFNRDGSVWWRENNAGTPGAAFALPALDWGGFYYNAADVDGDGMQDLIFYRNVGSSYYPYKLVWFRNVGADFVFAEQLLSIDPFPGPFTVFDADSDGDPDIILEHIDGGSEYLAMIENNGSGYGESISPEIIDEFIPRIIDFEIIDFDLDGLQDILHLKRKVFGGGLPSVFEISWNKNLGSGNFDLAESILEDTVGYNSSFSFPVVSDFTAGYFNADGALDFVISENTWSTLRYFQSAGAGAYLPKEVILNQSEDPRFVLAADANADGITDIVTGEIGDTNSVFYMLLNNGFGDFTLDTINAVPSFAVAAVDYNMDGATDFVTGNEEVVHLHLNKATPIFSGIENPDLASQDLLFPNPTEGLICLELPNEKVLVYSLSGKQMASYYTDKSGCIDVTLLAPGNYIIHSEKTPSKLMFTRR